VISKILKYFKQFTPTVVLKTVWDYIVKLFNIFHKDYLFLLASGISFNIILCVIPFVLILFTVVGIYLGYPDTYQGLNHYLYQTIPLPPDIRKDIVDKLLEQAKVISGHTLITGIMCIVGVMWTMSGLFGAMRDALIKIYRIEESYNYFAGKIRDFILIFVTLGLFIISTGLTSVQHYIQHYALNIFDIGIDFPFTKKFVAISIAFLVSLMMFYILFKLVPHSKFPKKSSFFSAFYASVFFEISKYFFNLYVLNFSNYTQVYGAFAVIVINLLWVYIISIIFVASAGLGKIFFDRHNLKIAPITNQKK
jgi:YihY family inner membrane protein